MMLPIVDAVAEAINSKETEMNNLAPLAKLDPIPENDTVTNTETEDEDEYNDNPTNQLTIRSLNEINELTVNSINSLNPGNDPESMVAFLPNVRRNTMEKIPPEDPRSKFVRKNTVERIPIKSRFTTIPVETKEEPVVEVVQDKSFSNKEEVERNFLLLSIAYASNIGGTGVVTGSPPNLVVPDSLNKNFGDTGLTFASWMAFAIPCMVICTIIAWLWLQKLQSWYPESENARSPEKEERAMKVIRERHKELGRMTMHEIQVLTLFIILILLWFFKSPHFMAGWGDIFQAETSRGVRVTVGSASPAILMCILLFILPQSYDFWPFSPWTRNMTNSPSLITWRLIETKMCWGVIFLLGGGFALADASQKSGLSTLLISQLNQLDLASRPVWLVNFVICVMTVTVSIHTGAILNILIFAFRSRISPPTRPLPTCWCRYWPRWR